MKKNLLGFSALVLAATLAFAFSAKKQNSAKVSKHFAVQYFEYVPQAGVPNPPTTSAQVNNTSNWTSRVSAPSCSTPLGSSFCYITFNTTGAKATTEAQALSIIANQLGSGLSDATEYTDNASPQAHYVTIFLKKDE